MPFKLRVGKRSGLYELSRDVYVLSIYIPDNDAFQYTISMETSGFQCFEYVCQRLNIKQSIFFGLRFKSHRMRYRWVDLDKPLRKQLDKHSNEYKLFFAVMFHIPHTHLLVEAEARWLYYLQMKSDAIGGRLMVSPEQAVLMASYSLQADFGDYDESEHTVEKLKLQKTLFPEMMSRSSQILEDLIRQALRSYQRLRGLQEAQAQSLYIAEAKQAEGYGQEFFPGKLSDGSDFFLGYEVTGITVRRLTETPFRCDWQKIKSVSSNKRNVCINTIDLAEDMIYQMEDAEMAKYAAHVCSLQHKFYTEVCTLSLAPSPDAPKDGMLLINRSENNVTAKELTPVNEDKTSLAMYIPTQPNDWAGMVYEEAAAPDHSGDFSVSDGVAQSPPVTRSQAKILASATCEPEMAHLFGSTYQLPYADGMLVSQSLLESQSDLDVAVHLQNLTLADYVQAVYALEQHSVLSSRQNLCDEESCTAADFLPCGSALDLVPSSIALKSFSVPDLFPPYESVSAHLYQDRTEVPNEQQEFVLTGRDAPLPADVTYSGTLRPVSVDERLATLELKLRDGHVYREFANIPLRRLSAGLSTAQKSENRARNRSLDVLPYEDTRVMLRPTKKNSLGYINASHLKLDFRSISVHYIAAQCPSKDTVEEFWQMVWEQGVRVLILLHGPSKSDATKRSLPCYPYWAESSQDKVHVGDYRVSLQFCSQTSNQITRALQLKHQPSGQSRQVYQIQCLCWPDDHKLRLPTSTDAFLGLLDDVSSVQRHLRLQLDDGSEQLSRSASGSLNDSGRSRLSSNGSGPAGWSRKLSGGRSATGSTSSLLAAAVSHTPSGRTSTPQPAVLVHCADGASRSGLYVLTELMIYCLEHNEQLEPAQALNLLRQQRMLLVQHKEQYRFAYECLVQYLSNSRLI